MSKLVDRILSLVEERANARERGKGKVSARYWSPGEECAMMRMQSIGLPDLVSLTAGRCVSTFIACVVVVVVFPIRRSFAIAVSLRNLRVPSRK